MTDIDNEEKKIEAVETLRSSIAKRRVSLTKGEEEFLRALLLDDTTPTSSLLQANRRLSDDMLFSLPNFDDLQQEASEKYTRPQHNHIGLWSAFHDGIRPKTLLRAGSKLQESKSLEDEKSTTNVEIKEGGDSVQSDEEVRHNRSDDKSQSSSIPENDAPPDHYDAWEVLKDEYANDFGFDYSPQNLFSSDSLDEDENHGFAILGTSADDKTAHPHVLSPPLLDSLMTFLPESIQNQNYWLKYSLVRDGASLSTLVRYVRAARRTILAIETMDGNVFGCFTSAFWKCTSSDGFYGNGESFLWRMRHNRNLHCNSLFEQAQMESEVDVYMYSHENEMVQLCTKQRIAVGGGALEAQESDTNPSDSYGFGLALNEFLRTGSSSPCATFRNPCLVDGGPTDQPFQIANLEVWTLTPCTTVDAAERLEMSQFFIHHQSTTTLGSPTTSIRGRSGHTRNFSSTSDFSGDDFSQGKFYRRIGENEENEDQRDIFQYIGMMNSSTKLL
jgi:TLD